MATGLLVWIKCSENESSLDIWFKRTSTDLVNGLIHGFLLKCPTVQSDDLSLQNEKAKSEQIASRSMT